MSDMAYYDVENPGEDGRRVDVDFRSPDVLRGPSAKSQSTKRVWELNEHSQWLDEVGYSARVSRRRHRHNT